MKNVEALNFFAVLSLYLAEHPEAYEEVRLAIEKLDSLEAA